jgi:outer membrane biosynthesis protein TonB
MNKPSIFALGVVLLSASTGLADVSRNEGLDAAQVSAGMKSIAGPVAACAGRTAGTVKIAVKVGADGAVMSAAVVSAPEPAIGSCVASAVQTAVFAKTKVGGSFTYPVAF